MNNSLFVWSMSNGSSALKLRIKSELPWINFAKDEFCRKAIEEADFGLEEAGCDSIPCQDPSNAHIRVVERISSKIPAWSTARVFPTLIRVCRKPTKKEDEALRKESDRMNSLGWSGPGADPYRIWEEEHAVYVEAIRVSFYFPGRSSRCFDYSIGKKRKRRLDGTNKYFRMCSYVSVVV